jgi:hypothetical protein
MDEDNSIQDETPKKGTRASEPVSAPKVSKEAAFSEVLSDTGSLSDVVPNEPARIHAGMTARRNEPQRDQTSANLEWPPKKEDLERLYIHEHLSAMKISKLYGLKYPNPKSGEAMILHYLKKWGIKRRDPAEHSRKGTKEVVDEWVRRYEAGESLTDIAGEQVSPVTVFNHLHKRGVKLRDKVEAQIEAVTKHPKKPFNGDPKLRAYMIGIAKGDYWVTTHGRAIRVRLGTTHPAMARLFRDLFEQYGPIYEYPKRTLVTEFEWCLDCDLDRSFEFLANQERLMVDIFSSKELFFSFLAGFFDAEGSIYYHKKHGIGAFEFSLGNTNQKILEDIRRKLSEFGFSVFLKQEKQTPERINRGRNIVSTMPMWRLLMWRFNDVRNIMNQLPLKHSEKVARVQIALELKQRAEPEERKTIISRWELLRLQIEKDVIDYIEEAREIFDTRTPN